MIDREELKRDLFWLFLAKGELKKNFIAIWGISLHLDSVEEIVDVLSEKDIRQVRFQVNNTAAKLNIKLEKDMTH